MLSGVRDICVVTTPEHSRAHRNLLGDGSQWGLRISYAVQDKPLGIPDAFNCAATKLDTSKPCSLILGDNFFYGVGLGREIFANVRKEVATCLGFEVANPQEYGVAKFDTAGKLVEILEKPSNPPSNIAITGFYHFPSSVFDLIKGLKPSTRGELEVSDLLNVYISGDILVLRKIERGTAWLDTGTPSGLLSAGRFVELLQERQGLMIGSPDEVAWRLGLIETTQLKLNASSFIGSDYGRNLLRLI
jgi:glucose-1-phosphate thymidylyltransferase